MIDNLRRLLSDLKALQRDISNEDTLRIAKQSLRGRAETYATFWFSTVSPSLTHHGLIPAEVLDRYSVQFAALLKLANPNNLRSRYLEVLKDAVKKFRDDLIIPIQTEPKHAEDVSLLSKMLADLPNEAENVYLKEAIDCAARGFLRAAAVLGWCAAVDRIHRTVEKIGFSKFNTVSQQMASATSGRFKRFGSQQNVSSLSDLREVFDSNISVDSGGNAINR